MSAINGSKDSMKAKTKLTSWASRTDLFVALFASLYHQSFPVRPNDYIPILIRTIYFWGPRFAVQHIYRFTMWVAIRVPCANRYDYVFWHKRPQKSVNSTIVRAMMWQLHQGDWERRILLVLILV